MSRRCVTTLVVLTTLILVALLPYARMHEVSDSTIRILPSGTISRAVSLDRLLDAWYSPGAQAAGSFDVAISDDANIEAFIMPLIDASWLSKCGIRAHGGLRVKAE